MDERKEQRKVRYYTENEHRKLCSFVNYGYDGDRPACEGEATHFLGERNSYVYQQMGICDAHWKTFYWAIFKELTGGGDETWMVDALMMRVGDEFRRREEQYAADRIREQVEQRKILEDEAAEILASPELAYRRISSPEVVYFIQADEGSPIKIGTTRHVSKRIAGLQTAHHARLNLLAMQRGGTALERKYHQIFSAARLEGEWFEPVPKLLATIAAINATQGS